MNFWQARSTHNETTQVCIVAAFWICFFPLLVLLDSCQKAQPQAFAEGMLNASVEEANSGFLVRLSWNTSERPLYWLIHRKQKGNLFETSQIALVDGDKNTFEDDRVKAGERYVYFLGSNQPDGHYKTSGKVEVEIPRQTEIQAEKGATFFMY